MGYRPMARIMSEEMGVTISRNRVKRIMKEEDLQWAEENAARVERECMLFLQPEWSVSEKIMPVLVEYAKAHPKWNISIQTHKYMHIP